ncbi:LemA family protein [Afipia sp. GAS231]|uniref:LemA family protein n=1 Tax=Afipia sp. GAS231 TaxID=1882747 RepID=UPI00087CAB1A|nr:LemA family protein [Afipia sp. GAS231]SDO71550.1 LemA protein [Afipia sp. GAS231]
MAATDQTFLQAIDFSGRMVRAANFALDQWWMFLLAGAALWLVLKIRSQHALIGQLDERADAAYGDVDALLIERHTLIGNLVEVVRAFATKEHDVIRDVLDARIDALEALGSGGGGVIRSETQIANVLQNLFTVSEKYPELASAAHYGTLRNDLIRIEDRITAARKFYNLAVEELNSVCRAFPANFIAMITKNPPREKFTLGERRAEFAEPVKVSL